MIVRALVTAGFVVFGLLFVGLEAVAHRPASRWVPVGVLAASLLRRRSFRVAALVWWWWIGWHFLVEP